MRRRVYRRFGVFCCFLCLILSACATAYRPPENTQTLYERLAKQAKEKPAVAGGVAEDLKVEVFPMMDQKIAKSTLGINPRQYDLLPVFLKVTYVGQDPVKVDLVESCVLAGNDQHWFAPVEVALDRFGKDDSAAMIGLTVMLGPFGLIGAATGAAAGAAIDSVGIKSTTVEEHYYRQRFAPTVLFPGHEASGVVFFDVPWERVDIDEFTISLPVINLNTGETKKTEVSFRTKVKRP